MTKMMRKISFEIMHLSQNQNITMRKKKMMKKEPRMVSPGTV